MLDPVTAPISTRLQLKRAKCCDSATVLMATLRDNVDYCRRQRTALRVKSKPRVRSELMVRSCHGTNHYLPITEESYGVQ